MATQNYDRYTYPTVSSTKLPGHPGHTTPEHDAAVVQFRAELESEGFTERLDTHTLLRFLRARKFDIPLAKAMYLECEKWRKEFGVDKLVKEFVYVEKPKVFEYYPQYYHKTDKDGRPVYIEQLGKIDLTAMYKITTADRMLQNLVVEYEKLTDPRLPACSRKAGVLLETCCTVMDLKGVGITSINSVYSYVKSASAISQNYYPERLGKLYLINAPWGFSSAFKIVKAFLDPVTVEKIHILGSGYTAELLSQIPKENLPKAFGGSCDCEGGCPLSDAGPWQEAEFVAPAFSNPEPTPTTTADAPAVAEATATTTAASAAAPGATVPAPTAAVDAPAPQTTSS
ncbi:phosphatidylinositol transfer protein [Peziza echinospora]|nr:phosphatidylinositol transfer protein [Peziza echinospora]